MVQVCCVVPFVSFTSTILLVCVRPFEVHFATPLDLVLVVAGLLFQFGRGEKVIQKDVSVVVKLMDRLSQMQWRSCLAHPQVWNYSDNQTNLWLKRRGPSFCFASKSSQGEELNLNSVGDTRRCQDPSQM